ncbi:MAG TPA: tRNA glutamyl-Q(34) synthetase GluQRS [Terracidiphilus sp.]|nr:tRNA glutamyl-Q(34) synthetase GluQRS [Terracidiphilus sp.]
MAGRNALQKRGYRGRLAPSPTGYLHVGHARTFRAASERARVAGGTLVMRMEDLDPDRSRAAYADAALEDLCWLGLRWQEGPDVGGPFAPYEQSRRRAVYLDLWRKLLERGCIYPCRCSRKDLASAAAAPHEGMESASRHGAAPESPDDEPVYPGTCRRFLETIPETLCSAGLNLDSPDGINWRFRVPDGEAIEFEDLNLGSQSFIAGHDFGDFVVWRRDGVPSYQLACVADDAAMAITEVVRGADLLKSTARQILLYRALGWKPPAWFHCELVLDEAGRRLAKRHDALSVRALRERGFTVEQVLSAEVAGKLWNTS